MDKMTLQTDKTYSKTVLKQPVKTNPPVKIRKILLTKVLHVRAEIAKVYNEARAGLIEIPDASKLVNILAVLHRVIADSDLESRLIELEAKLGGTK